ncbi:asparagine synthase (glutamine-hydrolyzing) [Lysobacter niastensis]|uniref:asparagine synthase (glutamine-hydrolyzing) n=1 Tax=Lysobacter niastensis TaxID=380629 RepID=A0ABU1WE26_9GAMM|nr:asparagine synthase-related protein [Lysobacter niastensis]MDR7135845.1 asparagine synthase (glutamine-hydrolyzing) [Lysobacter niastensis]
MKGICGFFQFDGRPLQVGDLNAMCAALVRNGLGQFQHWHGGSMALASAEWSGHDGIVGEPIVFDHPASGCVVVADVRLDDRRRLSATLGLAGGTRASDTELVLRAWLRWGERCIEQLDGDFAFAVWDPRQQRLFCARDRMGVKPLYVHHAPGRLFAFASSSTALLAHPQIPARLNEGRIADYLVTQLEGIDHTSTFYRDIERLPPAHELIATPGSAHRRRYWALQARPTNELPRGEDDWAAALTEALERAITRHLDSPGRVGCMLSGGLDSSTLALLANQQLATSGGGPLPTFSCIDTGADNEETRAIRAMLALPGFDATLVDRNRILDEQPALLDWMLDAEEPYDGSMPLIHAQYRAAAERGVDAVIDGIDGDSLFLEGHGLVRQLRTGRWLGALRNARGIDRIYFDRRSGLRPLGAAMRSALTPMPLRNYWHRASAMRSNLASSLISPEFARRVDLDARLAALRAHRSPGAHAQPANEAMEALSHPYLSVALERYHRVAAQHGVEPRHPMTDRLLVELCVNLPDRQRLHDGWSKAVLRHAMRTRLPAAVCWRQDKQHLGWSLTRTLLASQQSPLLDRLRQLRPLLAPYINLATLDAATARLGAGSADDPSHAAVVEAALLGSWLARQKA